MILLDTTFLIDLLSGKPETKKILNKKEEFATTQINMFELIRGFYLRNAKPQETSIAIKMFNNITMLPLNDLGILRSAEISADLLNKGSEISSCDCLIAGIALSYNVKEVVTRNVKHFHRIEGIKVIKY